MLKMIYINHIWNFQPELPITTNLDPLTLLTDDTQIATWNNEGLPNDRMSSENATILTNSDRWPLMVDPQVRDNFIFLTKSEYLCVKLLILIHSASRNQMD